MGQTTGDSIRVDITRLLRSFGYRASSKNVELIFASHMADSSDRPLVYLITSHDYELER